MEGDPIETEEAITIDRPCADVFAYMADVEREFEWQPDLKEASKDPPGPTRVGTQKRYVTSFMGRDLTNTYVVRAYVENERIEYETTPDSSLSLTSEVLWESIGASTRVTMRVHGKLTGFMRFLPKPALEAASGNTLRASLRKLKEVLERNG